MFVLRVHSVFLVAFLGVVAHCVEIRQPSYQYRYETEDVMKTAATGVPVRGYHVVEGGYYPETDFESSGRGYLGGGNFGRFGSGSGQSFSRSGYNPSFINGQRFMGGFSRLTQPISSGGSSLRSTQFAPLHHHPHHHEGGYVDKNVYNDEKKLLNGEVYEKADGKKGEVLNHGEEGFTHGKVALKKDNAEKGYYSDEQGDKKHIQDGKQYHEDKHFNQEAKNEDEKKIKKGHRKGHVTKGFKTTHHKDESGKTETFYDEESDEGDNYSFDGKSGNFGENSKSAVKGEHENGKFNSGQRSSQGHYDNEHVVDKGNLDKGEYGQKKYSSGGEVYGVNKGIDQHSLLGQQEANRLYKHYPYHYGGHVPYYSHY